MGKKIKLKIRNMRKDMYMETEDGQIASHKMSYTGDISKRRGEFGVFPTIKLKPGMEQSRNPKDWIGQTPAEAMSSGEFIPVKSRRQAEKLSFGSWKEEADKKDAMKDYKQFKKENRK